LVLFKTALPDSFRAPANDCGLTKLKHKLENHSSYTMRYLGELDDRVNEFEEGIKELKTRFKEHEASIKEL